MEDASSTTLDDGGLDHPNINPADRFTGRERRVRFDANSSRSPSDGSSAASSRVWQNYVVPSYTLTEGETLQSYVQKRYGADWAVSSVAGRDLPLDAQIFSHPAISVADAEAFEAPSPSSRSDHLLSL